MESLFAGWCQIYVLRNSPLISGASPPIVLGRLNEIPTDSLFRQEIVSLVCGCFESVTNGTPFVCETAT